MDADSVRIVLDPGDAGLVDSDQATELGLCEAASFAEGAQMIGQLCRRLQRERFHAEHYMPYRS